MDDFAMQAITEALEIHREILSGGLVMAGGMKAKHATDAEKEVCRMKVERIDRATKELAALAKLRTRVGELEKACKMAHDTIADVAGAMGPSWTTVDLDKTFRELVRVLFIDN